MEIHKNLLAESTTAEIKISFSKFSTTKLNLSSFFFQQNKIQEHLKTVAAHKQILSDRTVRTSERLKAITALSS